jgi:hypothetical protein
MIDHPSSGRAHGVRPLWWAVAVTAVVFALWSGRAPEPAAEPGGSWLAAERSLLTLRDGRLYLSAQPFTGFMIEKFAGGELRSRSAVSNGVLHGLSEGWHTNRVLEVREEFVHGTSHGRRLRWDQLGRKVSEAHIVDGKIEGVFRRWHDNGTLAEELTMKHGEPEGWSRAWYPSGCVKAEANVLQGKVTARHLYPDGEKPDLASATGTVMAKNNGQ